MAHYVEGNVISNSEVVYPMDCNSSIIGMVNCITNNIGLSDPSYHMEMNRIPSH